MSQLVLQVAFYAFFVAALVGYVRRPGPMSRDIVLVFGSMAGLFAFQILRGMFPAAAGVLGLVAFLMILAQPGLALRVARHVAPVPRWVDVAMLAGYVWIVIGLLTLGASTPWLVLLTAGYFLVGDFGAGAILFTTARRRVGVARWRLTLAAAAVALTGVALVASIATPAIGAEISRALGLLTALAFYLAFAPPAFLRRTLQHGIAYAYLGTLSRTQAGIGAATLWEQLAAAATSVTGALRGEVHLHGSEEVAAVAIADADRHAPHRTTISFGSGASRGEVRLFSSGAYLFADDDVTLLEMLGNQTLAAADREAILAEKTAMADRVAATNVELARASAAKSDFLAAMSHELRTPLNAIIGFSELLRTPPVPLTDDAVHEYADHIHGAGEHLLELINDILDLSRVEAGRLELRYETVDVVALVAETIATVRPLAEVKGLELRVEAPASLEAEVDAGRVRQVAYNLLANAIKFTPSDGRVTVAVDESGDSLEIIVADSGPGIEEADRERIFAAFEQVAPGSKEGTGLGLALTRRLVEAHGGRIWLESEVGRGSRFSVRLPLRQRPAAAEQPVTVDPGSGPLVLVIEDDDAAAELLRTQLRQAGYRTALAVTGDGGLRAATELAPAAILLDILLPGLDGWEVLRGLRSHAVTRTTPVMVISVVDHSSLGMALGANDFFVKPISRDALLAALARHSLSADAGRPSTVLAIDDDPAAAALYRDSLSAAGFRVVLAATGQDGLARARREPVDAIVLDMMLPDIDGFEVASRLKADPATAGIPILVVTGQALDDADKARLNEQALAVLSKGDEAIAGLREWLGQVEAAA